MEEKQALQLIVNFINTKSEAKITEFNQVNQALEVIDQFIAAHQKADDHAVAGEKTKKTS